MSWIDKLVGRSPIGPMQEHMRAAVECASQVAPLIDAMARGDDEAIASRRADIDRLEHKADELKHDIRSHLPRRLMLAMERRDMLDILDCQDSIADTAQDIAELAVKLFLFRSRQFNAGKVGYVINVQLRRIAHPGSRSGSK